MPREWAIHSSADLPDRGDGPNNDINCKNTYYDTGITSIKNLNSLHPDLYLGFLLSALFAPELLKKWLSIQKVSKIYGRHFAISETEIVDT